VRDLAVGGIAAAILIFANRDWLRNWIRNRVSQELAGDEAVVEQTCATQRYGWAPYSYSFEYYGGFLYSSPTNDESPLSYTSPENVISEPKRWLGRKILIHYGPTNPGKSAFLEDSLPGRKRQQA
jgi:hypothetical protein